MNVIPDMNVIITSEKEFCDTDTGKQWKSVFVQEAVGLQSGRGGHGQVEDTVSDGSSE